MVDIKKINQDVKVIGVIGHPIKQSLSPLMQNTASDITLGNYIYLPFDVVSRNLKDALKGLIALGVKGFNVTLPHKENITQYLNDVSEEASVIGAVNTVVNENGVLHGYNTDVQGIFSTLEPYREEINGSIVSVIGAGGAARSMLYTLIRHFKVKKINIINRTEQIAETMKDYFSSKMVFPNIKTYELIPPDLVRILKASKLIINTTSVGMYPETDDTPIALEKSFHKEQIVFDVIYNPLKTKFLEIAEKQGATILSGLEMFVTQGAKSFELWTGEPMPFKEIFNIVKKELENK